MIDFYLMYFGSVVATLAVGAYFCLRRLEDEPVELSDMLENFLDMLRGKEE